MSERARSRQDLGVPRWVSPWAAPWIALSDEGRTAENHAAQRRLAARARPAMRIRRLVVFFLALVLFAVLAQANGWGLIGALERVVGKPDAPAATIKQGGSPRVQLLPAGSQASA